MYDLGLPGGRRPHRRTRAVKPRSDDPRQCDAERRRRVTGGQAPDGARAHRDRERVPDGRRGGADLLRRPPRPEARAPGRRCSRSATPSGRSSSRARASRPTGSPTCSSRRASTRARSTAGCPSAAARRSSGGSAGASSRCWSRPTSPPAASTSRAWTTSSTTTSRSRRRTTSTAWAARRAWARRDGPSTLVTPDDGPYLTAIEKLINKQIEQERFPGIDVGPPVAPEGEDARGAPETPAEPEPPPAAEDSRHAALGQARAPSSLGSVSSQRPGAVPGRSRDRPDCHARRP